MKKIYLLLLLSSFHFTLQAQQCWKSISAGMDHSVAVRYDGTLWAWGYNGSGQLGDGTTTDKKVPLKIGGDSNWAEVSAGGNHTLAIKTDGSLWAWGENTFGQIGDGSSGSNKTSPVRIGDATDWKTISAGKTFSFAIKTDGTLWAWGDNSYGQLSLDLAPKTPQQVGTATDWKSVSAGGSHTVALKTNNTLWATGQNSYGQLGAPTTSDRSSVFILVNTTNDWQSVAAGYEHTIALKLKGELWAWGNNNSGQLGNGTTSEARYPIQIGTSNWTSIAAGNQSSFAINNNGTLWSWGVAIGGLTPAGSEVRLVPEQISDYANWNSISAGASHAFAFQTDQTLWAWGFNGSGKLGTDTSDDYPTPQLLSPTKPIGEATQYICGLGGTLTNLKVLGTEIKWYASATGGSPLLITLPLVSGTRYYSSSTKYGCESSERLEVTVVINLTTTPAPTGSLSQSFCGPSNVSALTATGSNIKWYTSIQGGNALETTTPLVNGNHYYATQTVNGCESPRRLDVVAAVNTTPAPVDLGNNVFCPGATIADLKVSGTGIKWYSADGGPALPSTTALVNGQSYFATQTISDIESCSRLMITPLLKPDIAPTGPATQEFCNSATAGDLTTYSSYPVKWYRNAGGNDLVDPGTLIKKGIYFASQTVEGCESTKRLEVAVTINETPAPAPTVPNNGPQTFCTSGTVANLAASGANIKWYNVLTGGTELPSSTQLVDGAHYYASQTLRGCESQSRLDVVVSVGPSSPPTGSALQRFCSNAVVENLIATGTEIKWYSASIGGSPLPLAAALVHGSHYYASQTINGCESTSRLDVTVSIGTGSPTGNASQTICSDDATVASLVATGALIQWYTSPTGGSPLESTTRLVNGNHYYASQTINSCESQTRLDVTVTLGTKSPTGSSTQALCSNATVANLGAVGSSIKWYAAATGGSPLATSNKLTNGTHYFASQTLNGCESQTRLEVTASVGVNTPVGESAQSFCFNATVADLEATGSYVKWYTTATGGSPLSSSAKLVTNTHYYASQTINGCESQVRLGVTVSIGAESPAGASRQALCYDATVGDLVAVGASIKWYSSATGGSPLVPLTKLVNGGHYFATQTVNGCESESRLHVTTTVGTIRPTASSIQTFCRESTIADLVANGTAVQWYENVAGGSPLPASTNLVNGTHYFATQTLNGCESQSRVDVTVAIRLVDAPEAEPVQALEHGKRIADLEVFGTNITWYRTAEDAEAGTREISPTESVVSHASYYATQTISGCESAPIIITVSMVTGVESLDESLEVYPNPVAEVLVIRHAELIDNVSVINSIGTRLISKPVNKHSTEIDLKEFDSGIYYVEMKLKNSVIVKKVVKR